MKKLLLIVCSVIFALSLVACSDVFVCGHDYADEYTCHERTCIYEGCGHVEAATTEHNFGEWVTIREASCEGVGAAKRECECGFIETKAIPETGHSYADEYTCHDRACTAEDCDYVSSASTAHNFVSEEVITEAARVEPISIVSSQVLPYVRPMATPAQNASPAPVVSFT